MARILLTFVGNRDPFRTDDTPGPVLSLLETEPFDRVVLIASDPGYVERAQAVVDRWAGTDRPAFRVMQLNLASPVDYAIIIEALSGLIRRVRTEMAPTDEVAILLDPGTPQMQTAWVLLCESGHIDAQLLQGAPPEHAGGRYRVRPVSIPVLRTSDRSSAHPVAERHTVEPHQAAGTGRAASTNTRKPADTADPTDTPHVTTQRFVGDDRALHDALDRADRVAPYELPVLIVGETGTGKSMVARRVHDLSPRSAEPFVVVNCAAITPTLAESELFGHTKGAFTGAAGERPGAFRSAHPGTLFLDEIGDLPTDLQAKLLHAIEEGKITPVGTDRAININVRLIAATHRDLDAMVADGTFRLDLLQRIHGVVVTMPPLRDHPHDIPALVTSIVGDWNRRYGESKALAPETIDALRRRPWPGNVRQLRNDVQALCALGRGDSIGPDLLPWATRNDDTQPSSAATLPFPEDGIDLREILSNIEWDYYRRALERTEGNRTAAARLLGINPPALNKALRERFADRDMS